MIATMYDTTTGEITKRYRGPYVNSNTTENESSIEGWYDSLTHYIDTSTQAPVSKPAMPVTLDKTTLLADGVDSITASNVPSPTTVTLDGNAYEVTDGVFEFTINQPGEYVLFMRSMYYLNYTEDITANES